jgi:RNA polymerase sigma-70 factor (ECF subfamily)
MAAYAHGQNEAFECLYLRHKQKLYSFLRRQCDNSAIAEELSHDTWVAVIRRVGDYQPKAKFTTWVFQIAHNRLVDHWRKQGRSTEFLEHQIEIQIETQADNSSNVIQLNELIEKLKTLPPAQVETLLLKVEGFSHAEIAAITDTKQETVKSRLRYITQRLHKSIEVQS